MSRNATGAPVSSLKPFLEPENASGIEFQDGLGAGVTGGKSRHAGRSMSRRLDWMAEPCSQVERNQRRPRDLEDQQGALDASAVQKPEGCQL